MRRKFADYGMDVFDTYELLEMLLYLTVPVKNTNPLAKEILHRFSGLDETLRATKEELMSVNGVGEVTASLINVIGSISAYCLGYKPSKKAGFSSYDDIAKFVLNYFHGKDTPSVIAISMDSKLTFLGLHELYSIDFSSGGVKADLFLDAALSRGATRMVIAHNHPFGSIYPTNGDYQTNIMVQSVLENADISYTEHYIVSGDKCLGFMFRRSKVIERDENTDTSLFTSCDISNSDEKDLLTKLLSFTSVSDPAAVADDLISHFGSLYSVLQNNSYTLSNVKSCAKPVSEIITLASAIIARSFIDTYKIGKKYLHTEMSRYYSALFFGTTVEKVILVSFDKSGKLIGYDLICEGSANSATFTPRRMLELAIKRGADSVVLMHNHPTGELDASNEDERTTGVAASMFNAAGVSLLAHYVVSGMKSLLIPFDYDKFKVKKVTD